jgi:hypothetical protein
LPVVQAVLAGIDQRSADIVMEHSAMRFADGTRDDGRARDSVRHHDICAFLPQVIRLPVYRA